MPYALIALLVALIVTGRFVFAVAPSVGAKVFVSSVLGVSVLLPVVLPEWWLPGLLLQVLLVIGLLLHSKFR